MFSPHFVMAHAEAAHLAADNFEFGTDRGGQFLAEVKIAPHTFAIQAIEVKNRLCIGEVGFVFHFAIASHPRRIVILQIDGQGF